MKFNSIEQFIPSGSNFQLSKQFFLELGFKVVWESGGFAGFEKNGCKFILQNFNDKHFAENLMMRVTVDDLDEFWRKISEKDLPVKFGVKLTAPTDFP